MSYGGWVSSVGATHQAQNLHIKKRARRSRGERFPCTGRRVGSEYYNSTTLPPLPNRTKGEEDSEPSSDEERQLGE